MQAYPFCICYGRLLVNAISLPDRSGESNIYPLCAAQTAAGPATEITANVVASSGRNLTLGLV
jgi:hypothetical protein